MNASPVEDIRQHEAETPHPDTITVCPPWCVVDHSDRAHPLGFHCGLDLGTVGGEASVRLWQPDLEGAAPGVACAGVLLSDAGAHELGLALVRAGDTLRRERMAAEDTRGQEVTL